MYVGVLSGAFAVEDATLLDNYVRAVGQFCFDLTLHNKPIAGGDLTPTETPGPDPLPRVVTSMMLLPRFQVKTHTSEPLASHLKVSGRPRQRSSLAEHVSHECTEEERGHDAENSAFPEAALCLLHVHPFSFDSQGMVMVPITADQPGWTVGLDR